MFVANFVGRGNPPAVPEVDLGCDLLSAYAMYDNVSRKLQRVALVSMRSYNATTGEARGNVTFQFSLGDAVTSVKVRRLHANKGVAAMGYDYGGPNSSVS